MSTTTRSPIATGNALRVARTALYDQLRRNTRRTKREQAFSEDPGAGAAWPAAGVAEERLLTALREAVDELGEEERELVEAFYFRREAQAAMAEQRGSTRKAVESKLGRIRGRLRERMKELLQRDA